MKAQAEILSDPDFSTVAWVNVLTFQMNNLIAVVAITVYTLIGISFEEGKLVKEFGAGYNEYKKRVPKLVPRFRRSRNLG